MVIRQLIITAVTVCALISAASGMSQKPPDPPYAPGQILLKFHEYVDDEAALRIVNEEGCTLQRVLGRTKVYLVNLPEGTDVMEAVKRFSSRPEVSYAEPNFKVERLQ